MMNEKNILELIESLKMCAEFLKRLNHSWSQEIKAVAVMGEKILNEQSGEDTLEWTRKVDFILHGKNQLADLFISSPAKREEFKEIKKTMDKHLTGLK